MQRLPAFSYPTGCYRYIIFCWYAFISLGMELPATILRLTFFYQRLNAYFIFGSTW